MEAPLLVDAGGPEGEAVREMTARSQFIIVTHNPEIQRYFARTIVLRDGYEFEGRKYKSLSAIARAITGTRWNSTP